MGVMSVLDGSASIAEAVRQVCPDVIVVHPISPIATVVGKLASFIANGQMETEYVNVESSQSALSGCIGAAAAGGRVFTTTASQGLAAMHEILFIASSLRLPIVAGVANRALAAPLSLYTDHSDTMTQRDCGWMQIYAENPQEAYDNLIQAYKIAEHSDVRTPVFVCMDGLITSHTRENVIIEPTTEVNEFVGKYQPAYSLLDNENPITVGARVMSDYYFEHKINQAQGLINARKIIKDIGQEFGDRFGRYYGNVESYRMEDAETAVVVMSSAAGTVKETAELLRARGEKVGVLKLRVFRPFPFQEIRDALSRLQSVAVLDRSFTPGGFGGPLFQEIRTALFDLDNHPHVYPYIFGLGGRDITTTHVEKIYKEIKENPEKESEKEKPLTFPMVKYINLRE